MRSTPNAPSPETPAPLARTFHRSPPRRRPDPAGPFHAAVSVRAGEPGSVESERRLTRTSWERGHPARRRAARPTPFRCGRGRPRLEDAPFPEWASMSGRESVSVKRPCPTPRRRHGRPLGRRGGASARPGRGVVRTADAGLVSMTELASRIGRTPRERPAGDPRCARCGGIPAPVPGPRLPTRAAGTGRVRSQGGGDRRHPGGAPATGCRAVVMRRLRLPRAAPETAATATPGSRLRCASALPRCIRRWRAGDGVPRRTRASPSGPPGARARCP